MFQKLLDVGKLREAGWESRIDLRSGIASTVDWYRAHRGDIREAG
jgi:GDP-L-fucose synthase